MGRMKSEIYIITLCEILKNIGVIIALQHLILRRQRATRPLRCYSFHSIICNVSGDSWQFILPVS